MAALVSRLQQTKEGKAQLQQMMQHYQYAKQNGLFDVQ
jgi:hypothetical protein